MTDAVQTQRLTADEFWDLYGEKEEFADGLRLHYELINGRVVDTIVPGVIHAAVQGRLTAALVTFVNTHALGLAGPELHTRLSEYSMLVPDIVFIRADRLAQVTDPDRPLLFAPDLVVEIISPSNSDDEMQEKVDLYFAAGTQTVWLVYPKRKEVVTYHASGTWQALRDNAVLTDDLLPGLSISLAELFAPITQVSGGTP